MDTSFEELNDMFLSLQKICHKLENCNSSQEEFLDYFRYYIYEREDYPRNNSPLDIQLIDDVNDFIEEINPKVLQLQESINSSYEKFKKSHGDITNILYPATPKIEKVNLSYLELFIRVLPALLVIIVLILALYKQY